EVARNQLVLKQAEFCPDVCCLYYSGEKINLSSGQAFKVGITLSKPPREIAGDFPLLEHFEKALAGLPKERFTFKIMPSNYRVGAESEDYTLCRLLYEFLFKLGYAVEILENKIHS